MKEEFFKIFIAFFVGLIPFLLKIYFDQKKYIEGQSDKYGSFLFEKQYKVYIQIFTNFRKLYDDIVEVSLLNFNGEEIEEFIKEKGLNKRNDYLQNLNNTEKHIEENSLLIPNQLMKLLHNFIDLSYALHDTYMHQVLEGYEIEFGVKPYVRSFVIKDNEELQKFADQCLDDYYQIMIYLKSLLGTEYLSKRTRKYMKKDKKNNGIVMRITQINVNK